MRLSYVFLPDTKLELSTGGFFPSKSCKVWKAAEAFVEEIDGGRVAEAVEFFGLPWKSLGMEELG